MTIEAWSLYIFPNAVNTFINDMPDLIAMNNVIIDHNGTDSSDDTDKESFDFFYDDIIISIDFSAILEFHQDYRYSQYYNHSNNPNNVM